MAEPKKLVSPGGALLFDGEDFDAVDPDGDLIGLTTPALDATATIDTITALPTTHAEHLKPNPAADFAPDAVSPLGSNVADIPDFYYKPTHPLTETKNWPLPQLVRSLTDLKLTPDMYPNAGFLPTYLAWASEPAPAPAIIHLVCALAAMAVCMGARWRSPFHRISPNFYAMVIAGSGVGKSTAMRLMRKLLERTFDFGAERLCVEELASKVAVVTRLSQFVEADGDTLRPTLWCLDEGDILLNVIQQPHSAQFATTLTTIYDGDDSSYFSLNAERIALAKPCVSILTGTAPEWLLQRHLTPEFLRGGLFGRFWLVPAAPEQLRCDPPEPDAGVMRAMAAWLAQLDTDMTAPGEKEEAVVAFAPDADLEFAQFSDWLWRCKNSGTDQAEMLKDTWARVTAHVAKLALLYHVSTYHSLDEPVNLDCLRRAIAFAHRYLLPGHLWAVRYLERPVDSVQGTIRQVLASLERHELKAVPLGRVKAGLGKTAVTEDALTHLWQGGKIGFWVGVQEFTPRGRPPIWVALRDARDGTVAVEDATPPPLAVSVLRWRAVRPAFLQQALERDKPVREDGLDDDLAPDDDPA